MSIEIIPAIDIIDGKCVRLTQGDFGRKKIYNEHPLEVARQFEDAGLRSLHLVDLDGARLGAVRNWNVLEAIASRTSLIVDFGGGIASTKDLEIVFDSGAAFATVSSIAVSNEPLFSTWIEQFGPDLFMLGADVRNEKISIHGWQQDTDIPVYDFIEKFMAKKISRIFCTDIGLDGLLEGPALPLYKNIIEKFPALHFIASGGIRSMGDIEKLEALGCRGVIIGKAIYEGLIKLEELGRC
jgi:phosphoribosylformimino-5-aminoimidazole carboxamide ribotide isomerase